MWWLKYRVDVYSERVLFTDEMGVPATVSHVLSNVQIHHLLCVNCKLRNHWRLKGRLAHVRLQVYSSLQRKHATSSCNIRVVRVASSSWWEDYMPTFSFRTATCWTKGLKIKLIRSKSAFCVMGAGKVVLTHTSFFVRQVKIMPSVFLAHAKTKTWYCEISDTTCGMQVVCNSRQDAQLSQRDRAAGCVIVFAKSRRLELGHNILRTL